MKLKKITTRDSGKATIHLSGKMGFSQSAIMKLHLNESKYVSFALNDEDKKDQNLYMMIVNEKEDDTLKINKAGNYYYINARNIFEELNIDFKRKNVIFDIKEIEYEGENIYKLIRREIDRKQKSE
jgi:hypothetical protein